MSIKFNGKLIAGIPDVSNKQDTLVSGENIKTINNESILGSGNFDVSSIEPLTQEEYDRRRKAGELEEGKYYSTPDNLALNVLDVLYPVGSLYLTTNNVCPLATLGIGTWILEATDRVLQGAGTRGAVGTTVNESLPNITGQLTTGQATSATGIQNGIIRETTGAFGPATSTYTRAYFTSSGTTTAEYTISANFNASRSSSTYQDNAPVQQNAYLISVFRRVS